MIDQVKLKNILPHRFPMLLIDEVSLIEPGNKILAIKNVSCNESCFSEILDTAEASAYAYPCSLIIESFGQAAAVLYSLSVSQKEENLDDSVMLLGSMAKISFCGEVFPGGTLEHHIVLDKLFDNTAICSGEILSDNKLVARSERIVILQRPAEILFSGSN
ncbi:MAG: hypothetical protein RLZZ04_3980 [Cyanobacteriota bacterium]|jgi:3-hydroxyacyl-[acyl-carrier-protein] dehydratase